jgi:integrase
MVRRTLVIVENKEFREGPTKNKKSRRVELSAVAVEALREHYARMLKEGHAGSTYVFCDSQGGPLRRQNVLRRSLRPIFQAAGIRPIRFHDLRHTCATLLMQGSIHPKVVSERLGHSKVSTTLEIYSHVLPSMQREAAAEMDRILASD